MKNNGARALMYPQEARLRNFTYSSAMMIDLNMKITRRFGENLSQMETYYKILPKNSYRKNSCYVEIGYLYIETIQTFASEDDRGVRV